MKRAILTLFLLALGGGLPGRALAGADAPEVLVRAEVERALGPQLELRALELPRGVRLQKGTGVSVRWDRPPHPGKSWITVWLRPPGKTEDRAMLVRIDLAERQSVVVVRRTVAAGNPISADDLAPAFRAVDGALEVSPEAIAGAVARIELSPGHVVRAGDVELPPPVARGTMVTVRVQSPGVSVSASGRLEQTARPGEEVAVRVEATLRVLQGRLVGPSLVLVEGGPR